MEICMPYDGYANMPVRIDAPSRAVHVAATSLVHDDVYDDTGRRVGNIEEVILDARTGCARYVVLRSGGFLGFGRQRIAIPWRALTPNLEYHRCVVDVAQTRLTAIPVFDDDPWLQRIQPPVGAIHYALRQPILPARSSSRVG
jgi:sporulation protein YlmC with PRC-barrel domain